MHIYVAKGMTPVFSKRPGERVSVPLLVFVSIILMNYWKMALPLKGGHKIYLLTKEFNIHVIEQNADGF